MKRPAFQFYPGDWRKDVELRSCSLAARGLWVDLMCVMHECDPYGHLVVNGTPMTPKKLEGQIGVPAAQIKRLLDELIENGVARTTAEGLIYSKRMVDDERTRNARAEGGKAGSEHGQKGAEHGSKGGRPAAARGDKEPPLNPPPSSSSSATHSEAKASADAGAPAVVDKSTKAEQPDTAARAQLWTDAVAVMAKANIGEQAAREFVGQLKAKFPAVVADAIQATVKAEPADPKGYLTRTCENMAAERKPGASLPYPDAEQTAATEAQRRAEFEASQKDPEGQAAIAAARERLASTRARLEPGVTA